MIAVTRPALYERTDDKMRMRLHDLRATFVTLALAKGKTHTWIKRRTQHGSDAMINRYDHAAGMLRELQMGNLKPLHEAIPELAEMEPSAEWLEAERSLKGRQPGLDDEDDDEDAAE